MGPLDGLRVLDLTSVLMGPFATQTLGDLGAEIIKVEAPEGDIIRQIGPSRHPGMGPLFLNTNRSKRSIALDLKNPAGRKAMLRLARNADLVVSNIRPRSMAQLGLSYEDFEKVNPQIIYAALIGFDLRGPYADRPAYDDLIQGGACLAYSFSRAGRRPAYVPTAIADRFVGVAAINAILAAVIERNASGRGQKIEIPMFETMVALVLGDHLGGLTFDPPFDQGGYQRQLSPDRRPYQTSDGYVCALIYNDGHWERFFKAIGRPDIPQSDARFASFASRMANIDEVYAELSRIMLTKTTVDWLQLFLEADVPAMPMHSFESVLEDEHLKATGFFRMVEHPSEGPVRSMAVPVRFSRSDVALDRLAPRLGEHGREILAEAGFGNDEIVQMTASGALCLSTED
ncbi:CaiB/BaiF CoA transferase family protein [Mesorhizobium sp. B4-1-4]|uniref:CaiB/BaiF CoA transferase family protein n=1 Tax=Mesorhizobium sp. B4-1-4 TaxID=2589888 RepID=UPI0011284B8B|nr:CoA transferase [Mesorhizobium sp. B4-1-4]UCI31944.1 CoA transferase [Mesorhizobium sp. B4-1-4]